MDVNEEMIFFRKLKKIRGGGASGRWGGGGRGSGLGSCVGGKGGCERKIEVFVKIQNKKSG